MNARTRRIALALALALVASLAACKKAADLSGLKDKAMGLVQQYGPQLKDLGGKLEGLIGRADQIPASVPGADKIKGLLTEHKGTLTKLTGLLDNLPGKVTAAKSAADITAATTEVAEAVGPGLTSLTAGIAEATTQVGDLETAAKAAAAAPAADFKKTLSSGFELSGAGTGIESQLVAFIEDAQKPVDKTTWFDFDRLTFQEGKTELDADKSGAQLENIAQILKAFPAVKLKIGGYTDNTGTPEANKKISGARAETVMAALVAKGVAKDRLEAEGYGPEFPVCAANDTDECKAKNRRIAVRVTAK